MSTRPILFWNHSETFSGHHLRLYAPSDQAFLLFSPRDWAQGSSNSGVCISLLIFTSSHLLIFISSHPHIFTFSHPHMFTFSHLYIFSFCLLALLPLLPSPSFLFLFWRQGQGQCQQDCTKRNLFARNDVRSPKNWGKNAISRCPPQPFRTKRGSIVKKLRQKCNFNLSGVTLSHVTRFDRQKLNCLLFAGSRCNPLARNEGRSPKAEWKLRFFLCVENFWMLCAKFSVCKSICVKAPV